MSYTVRLDVGVYFSPPSPLSPFRIKFQNFFPTFSRALIVELSDHFEVDCTYGGDPIDRDEFAINGIQPDSNHAVYRVSSSFIVRSCSQYRARWKMSVSRFCVSVHWRGAGGAFEFRVLTRVIVFLNCDRRWGRIFSFCFTQGKIIIRIYWMESLIWIMAILLHRGRVSLRGKKLYLRFPLSN